MKPDVPASADDSPSSGPMIPGQPVPPDLEMSTSAASPETATRFDFDVAVVGLGHAGLPMALALTAAGHSVLGYDVSEDRRDDIRAAHTDLPPSARRRLGPALAEGRLQVTGDPARLASARTVLITVRTLVGERRIADLPELPEAAATAVAHAVAGQVLIVTSRTYVGSSIGLFVTPLLRRGLRVGEDIHVAIGPERMDPDDVTRIVQEVTGDGGAAPLVAEPPTAAQRSRRLSR